MPLKVLRESMHHCTHDCYIVLFSFGSSGYNLKEKRWMFTSSRFVILSMEFEFLASLNNMILKLIRNKRRAHFG